MIYYNTLTKIYKSKKSPSLRIIHYPGFQKKYSQKELDSGQYAFQSSQIIDRAELAEGSKNEKIRDLKQESIARAKRNIKEIIRNNYSERLKMITLTYAKKCEDRTKVLNDIKNMCKRYYDKYKHELKYIASLEWQKDRHCLHVHLIVDCPFIHGLTWSKVLWLQGFIKINTISYKKNYSECLQAVDYVLKYISKDAISCGYYDHLYFRSKNWNTYVEKDYSVMKGFGDITMLATLFFNSIHYSMIHFTWKDYKDEEVEIYDFYS